MKVKNTSSLTSFTISSLILARSASLLPLSRSTSLFFLRPTSPFTSSDLKVYKSIHIFKLIIDRAIWKSMSGENPMPKIWALGGVFTTKCGFQESKWWFTIVNMMKKQSKLEANIPLHILRPGRLCLPGVRLRRSHCSPGGGVEGCPGGADAVRYLETFGSCQHSTFAWRSKI